MPPATPVVISIVPMPVETLTHVPPPAVLLSVVVLPTHTLSAPVIGPGFVLTVTITEAVHPLDAEATIVVVPTVRPVTIPVVAPTVATVVILLDQLTPGVVVLNVVVPETHMPRLPVIAATPGVIVITLVTMQFVASIYVIVAVPDDTPQTVPVPETVATDGSELLHAPPLVVLVSVTQLPIHTVDGPVIAPGKGLTENTAVVVQLVGAV